MTFWASKRGMCCSLGGGDIHLNSCVFALLNHFPLPTSSPPGHYGNCNYFLSIWQHNQLIPRQSHYTPDCQMPNRNLYYLYLCLLSCMPVNSIVTSLVAFTGAMTLMSSDKWSEDSTGELIFYIRTCATKDLDTDWDGSQKCTHSSSWWETLRRFYCNQCSF